MTITVAPVLTCDDCQVLAVMPNDPERPTVPIPAGWRAVGVRHYCPACKPYHAHERDRG